MLTRLLEQLHDWSHISQSAGHSHALAFSSQNSMHSPVVAAISTTLQDGTAIHCTTLRAMSNCCGCQAQKEADVLTDVGKEQVEDVSVISQLCSIERMKHNKVINRLDVPHFNPPDARHSSRAVLDWL